MSIRTFRDNRGRTWWAWTVKPTYVDRRFRDPPEDDPPVIERRQRTEVRIKIGEQWVNGWLAFETADEKRRLANPPEGWHCYTDQQLAELCSQAHPVTTVGRTDGAPYGP